MLDRWLALRGEHYYRCLDNVLTVRARLTDDRRPAREHIRSAVSVLGWRLYRDTAFIRAALCSSAAVAGARRHYLYTTASTSARRVDLSFLPRDAMLPRYPLSSCVCPSVRHKPVLYQRPNADNTVVFWLQKYWQNSNAVLQLGHQIDVRWAKIGDFRRLLVISQKWRRMAT